MNIKQITEAKLSYNAKELEETETLYQESKDKLSQEANAFLREKISSFKKNVEYYTEVLKILEGE